MQTLEKSVICDNDLGQLLDQMKQQLSQVEGFYPEVHLREEGLFAVKLGEKYPWVSVSCGEIDPQFYGQSQGTFVECPIGEAMDASQTLAMLRQFSQLPVFCRLVCRQDDETDRLSLEGSLPNGLVSVSSLTMLVREVSSLGGELAEQQQSLGTPQS